MATASISRREAIKLCDENTIGVVAILGSTFDGSYEPIEEICDVLDAFQSETGIDVPRPSTVHRGRSSHPSSIRIFLGLPPPARGLDQRRAQVRARVSGRRLGRMAG